MTDHNLDIHELANALPKGEVVMLTSLALDGRLNARPMLLQDVDAGGSLWFFIGRSSSAADEIKVNHQVAVVHADEGEKRYVAITGKAWLVNDLRRVQELWLGDVVTWFPLGIEDPDLTLLRIDPQTAERWEEGNHHVHLTLAKSQPDASVG